MKPYETESFVREKLGEMFGTKFRRGRLITGYDSANRPQVHEFDIVSENMEIIGEVKSGRCSRNNYNLALVDCVYLSKIEARMKLMVFTDKELYEYFRYNSQGLVSSDIRAILVVTNVDMGATVMRSG
jgi:hypothetical protein